jgi:Co/Zn/Cd efflux system component
MALWRTVRLVLLFNLVYFGVEFGVALAIGSVSLFADSIDFLEDATVNGLILLAFGFTAVWRRQIGYLLAGIILVPSLATLWAAWEKYLDPIPPEAFKLTITGLGALAVNATCAYLLACHRHAGGSLVKAAFLSARNDVLANAAIIATGLATALYASAWPDLVVGIGIFALNAGAALEVIEAARKEIDEAPA